MTYNVFSGTLNPTHFIPLCTSLQIGNHASNSALSFYRPDALPAAQPIASKHWKQFNIIEAKHEM